jgi:diguanylate cyclase (GGDEF)-like protein
MAPFITHPQLQSLNEKKRPAARLVVIMLVLSCVLVCAFTGWEIRALKRDRLEEAEVSTSNIARALALHAETTMKVADLVLENIVERAEKDGLQEPSIDRLRAHLDHISTKAGEVHGLFVYDEHGKWMATSLARTVEANNADREYFNYHRTHSDRKTRVGAPIRSRSTGVWIIPVSRRIEHADGKFAGVALATLRLDFFESAYNKLDVGKTGTIILALDSGMLYYRRPRIGRMTGMDISSGPLMQFYRTHGPVGTAMLVAKVDGVKRLYSYRHLGGFPLIVAVALSADEIYAGWWEASILLFAALIFFIVILLCLGRRLLRQLAIRERLEEQLHSVSDDLAHANEELSTMALKDGLTQLANRRAFDQALRLEFARAQRHKTPISLLMLDVDHFKKFNDHYGHPAGDDCLRRVADAIASQVPRQTDLSARYGGEEFVVLLPATESEGAAAVAERIRHAVLALSLAHAAGAEKTVTVSIGVATLTSRDGTNGTPADLVGAADTALYRSKASGRNQVTVTRGKSTGRDGAGELTFSATTVQ